MPRRALPPPPAPPPPPPGPGPRQIVDDYVPDLGGAVIMLLAIMVLIGALLSCTHGVGA